MTIEEFDAVIRRVQDFPKPGIEFYDITSILSHKAAFRFVIDTMANWVTEFKADTLLAVEARGFLFASPLALQTKLPLILARKNGKLPGETWCQNYNLEYGNDSICIHRTDISPGSRVFLVDDLIATGGTFEASAKLITEKASATVVCFSAVIGLPVLGYEKVLGDSVVKTIINF